MFAVYVLAVMLLGHANDVAADGVADGVYTEADE